MPNGFSGYFLGLTMQPWEKFRPLTMQRKLDYNAGKEVLNGWII
jgi:hypothetical protein